MGIDLHPNFRLSRVKEKIKLPDLAPLGTPIEEIWAGDFVPKIPRPNFLDHSLSRPSLPLPFVSFVSFCSNSPPLPFVSFASSLFKFPLA
jgi:hypothetical protein